MPAAPTLTAPHPELQRIDRELARLVAVGLDKPGAYKRCDCWLDARLHHMPRTEQP